MTRWHESRQIIFHVLLFALCCLLAFWIRHLVDADTLSDLATVGIEFGGLALFITAAAAMVLAAYRARVLAERVALRVIPVALVIAGAVFVKTSYADVSVALHALTSHDEETTKIELGAGGRDVRLTGSLTEGAGQRLASLLDSHPAVTRIHLTSDGGLVDEGEALRKVIAAHRLTTFVPDYCVSACTLALLGGHERLMMADARIGFHAPFEEGLFGQVFEGDKVAERASYVAAGVAPAFVDEALGVASTEIWTPDAELLKTSNVVTGIVDRYRFPDSNLDGIATLVGARTTLLRNFPAAQALYQWRPRDIDAIAASYLSAYRDGVSEGAVTDGLKAVIGAAAEAAIVNGDDETIVGYGRFLSEAMQATTSDEDCTAIGSEADLVEAEKALDQGDGRAERSAVALLTRALRAPQRVGRSVSMQGDAATMEIAAQGTCAEIRGFYKRALGLPRHDAARLIRSFVQSQVDPVPDLVIHEN